VADTVRIWYVSSQRLCNFHCTYCVSTGDWAKSDKVDWRDDHDRKDFEQIVRWLGTRPFPVGIRLATLGEPFASADFMAQAAWLTKQPAVEYVELLTNGSLLKSRLPKLVGQADLSRLSLWITHHHTEMPIERLIANARLAQDEYGCFVVVNALLFPDNEEAVQELRAATTAAGLRFNLDLGYDPSGADGTYGPSGEVVPLSQRSDFQAQAIRLGANPDLLTANIIGLDRVHDQPCAAGHNYFFIGIDGEVYACSRYYELGESRLGNVLEPGFELPLRADCWAGCRAPNGCSNKEDFLNLKVVAGARDAAVPSLGWLAG
jgi:MoaA/NifB/PqqE/SkfB family radical SAM enzyme